MKDSEYKSPGMDIASAPDESMDFPSAGPSQYVAAPIATPAATTSDTSPNLRHYVTDQPVQGRVTHPVPMVAATPLPPTYNSPNGAYAVPMATPHSTPVVMPVQANTAARPPPQVVPNSSNPPRRHRNNDACLICGLSTCAFSILCLCCILPLIVFVVVWFAVWIDGDEALSFDDDFFTNNHSGN